MTEKLQNCKGFWRVFFLKQRTNIEFSFLEMENSLNAEVAVVAAELTRAVELTMDPSVPHAQRLEAYTACEQFKETSPFCAQCGFFLAQSTAASHIVRHFGLQLMEHCVKYRWNQISQQEKIFIKVVNFF